MVSIHNLKDEAVNFPRNPLIEGENFTAYLAVPLMANAEVKGILDGFHRQTIEPDQG